MPNKKLKWEVIGKDFNSPFIRNYIWTLSPLKYPEIFKAPIPLIGITSKQNDIEYITVMESWAKTHEALKERVLKDHNFVEEIIDKTNGLGESFGAWSKENIFDADLVSKKPKELVSLLNIFVKKQSELYSYGISLPILDFQGFAFVESNLERILKEKVPKVSRQKYFDVFTEPIFNSFAQDQEEDLLRLFAKFNNKKWSGDVSIKNLEEIKSIYPDFYAELKRHTNKHAWVYYVYTGPAFTEKNFFEFIKDYVQKKVNPTLKLEEFKKKRERINLLREKYIKELKLNAFDELILRLAGKVIWAKPRRKDYQSRAYFYFEKLLKEIAKRLYISLSQVRSIPIEILKSALEKGKTDLSDSQAIFNFHICLPFDGKVRVLSGKQAQDFYDKYVDKEKIQDLGSVKELKGAVAYKGVVKGNVKIINRPEDMLKMKDGDILVAVATTPSIVSAMKKAGAIVTDEGGLTCHASIVSRELGITCVVGTKFATTVLKDGDLVEVDANKGIVKILKK